MVWRMIRFGGFGLADGRGALPAAAATCAKWRLTRTGASESRGLTAREAVARFRVARPEWGFELIVGPLAGTRSAGSRRSLIGHMLFERLLYFNAVIFELGIKQVTCA